MVEKDASFNNLITAGTMMNMNSPMQCVVQVDSLSLWAVMTGNSNVIELKTERSFKSLHFLIIT